MQPIEGSTLIFSDAIQVVRFIEVRGGAGNFSLILEIEQSGKKSKAIYYPERGVCLTLDVRIPKPYEVRHKIAYAEFCQMLGWDIAVPTVPFSLDADDHGALSPFFDGVEVKHHYFYESLRPNLTWFQIAVLDYLAGLVDRTSNDILFLPDAGVKVTDNGLSFVQGTDFSVQISVIRRALRGMALPVEILQIVEGINLQMLEQLAQYLYKPREAIEAVLRRKQKLLEQGVVL